MQNISLTNLPKNHTALIVNIFAGRRAAQRLTSLGLTPGTRITKMSSAPFQGPVQLLVRNTRLVIGWGLATKIIVSEILN
ncbi:MAG: FeoA family protein [Promethearchaeota archaeon]